MIFMYLHDTVYGCVACLILIASFLCFCLDRLHEARAPKSKITSHPQTDLNALLDHGIHCAQHSNSCDICGGDLSIGDSVM